MHHWVQMDPEGQWDQLNPEEQVTVRDQTLGVTNNDGFILTHSRTVLSRGSLGSFLSQITLKDKVKG